MSVDRQQGAPASYPRRPRPRPLVNLIDDYEAGTIVQTVSAPRRRVSGRLVLGGIIVGGLLAQHALVSMPVEAQPTRLAAGAVVPGAVGALASPDNLGGGGADALGTGAPHRALGVVQPSAAHPTNATKSTASKAVARVLASKVAPSIVVMTAGGGNRLASPMTTKLSKLLPAIGVAGDLRRIAMSSNGDGAILHVPSVSAAAIRQALWAANSPVLNARFADHKDAAEYIWDEGRVLGIDPAVLLGIFQHESAMGVQGMARTTRSIGNIRPVGNQPQVNGYRLYSSWEEGIDDCYRLLRQYARNGASTVSTAIPVWAPPTDNNDDSSYISNVLTTMSSLHQASAAS